MCGIAGLWSARGPFDREQVVEAMIATLVHRGPDAEGTWADPGQGVVLGHRRLAVVGLGEAGAQPMTSRSGRWVLTYNGEIYNAPGVGARLESDGVSFRGTSDTEVLVEALDAWGPEPTLEAIDGMFAFAAWDREQHRLVLARDRMGEKPLSVTRLDGGVAFASEVRALRVVPGFDASVDPAALALFLRFKYVPTPWTIHPGTHKLVPGHWLELRDPEDDAESKPYWSMREVVEAGAEDPLPADGDAVDRLDSVLGRAVAARLRADVPLGAFLSGGIDSALIATVAAEQLDRPLQTFTIGSPEADLDESSHARAVAERIGAEHTELVVTPEDALAEVPGLAATWDEPFGDSSQLPTLLVSRLARRSVTVALSGDGGDELFGGYNRHAWLPRTWGRVGSWPAGVRRSVASVMARPDPGSWDRLAQVIPEGRRPRLFGLKVAKLASVLDATDEAAAYGRLVSHWQHPVELVPGVHEPDTLTHRRDDWPRAGSLGQQLMAVDALTYLPDDVLVKVDRATMAHSLEARVPFLAREVVELAARLPLAHKIEGAEGKRCLRELLARRHPRDLFERPKSGFGIPIAPWLRGPLRTWAEDLLDPAALRAGGLLDPVPIRGAWAEHLSGRADRSYELWDVLMFQSWRQSLERVSP